MYLERSETQGIYLNTIEAIYNKLIDTIRLNREKLKAINTKLRDKDAVTPSIYSL